MNVHNHSIWPPPDACNFNHPAPAARFGALQQQLVRAALIFPVAQRPDEAALPVINRSDKE
jgi:hypothetical protein